MIIICPHCNENVIIEKINCGIFIHGTIKNNGKQVPPHLSNKKCKLLIRNGSIYGCGKRFQIIENKVIKI
jgi:hypothetical protein